MILTEENLLQYAGIVLDNEEKIFNGGINTFDRMFSKAFRTRPNALNLDRLLNKHRSNLDMFMLDAFYEEDGQWYIELIVRPFSIHKSHIGIMSDSIMLNKDNIVRFDYMKKRIKKGKEVFPPMLDVREFKNASNILPILAVEIKENLRLYHALYSNYNRSRYLVDEKYRVKKDKYLELVLSILISKSIFYLLFQDLDTYFNIDEYNKVIKELNLCLSDNFSEIAKLIESNSK